jgi:hypothetical protein
MPNKEDMKTSTALTVVGDDFDGFTSVSDGGDSKKRGGGLFKGCKLVFGNSCEWEDRDADDTVDESRRFLLAGTKRVVTRWGKEKKPLETIVLGPGEVVPNLDDGPMGWNNQLPKEEWVDGPGGLRGPWQFQYLLYLLCLQTMQTYTWATSSLGGKIAVEEVVDAIQSMRRFRPGASPIVTLGTKFMKTKFGGRQRPFLKIVHWDQLNLDDDDGQPSQAALAAPAAPAHAAVEVIEPEPVKAKPAKAGKIVKSKSFVLGDRVKPVSLSEELNDEIPHM